MSDMGFDQLLSELAQVRDEMAATRRANEDLAMRSLRVQRDETGDPELAAAITKTLDGRQGLVDLLHDPAFQADVTRRREELQGLVEEAAELDDDELADRIEEQTQVLDQRYDAALAAEKAAEERAARRAAAERRTDGSG